MADVKQLLLSQTSVITTGLNALANNSLAISSAFDNTIGATGDGSLLCDIELVVTYGTAATANTGCSVWFLQSQDGTNYEDGGTGTTPKRTPDVVLAVDTVTTGQRLIRKSIPLPPGLFKVLLKNDGTGQAMAATGNTLKIRPYTARIV